MPIRTDRRILLAGLLLLCLCSPSGTQAQHSLSCQLVYFKVTLNANDNFERELGGGLLFRVRSEKNPGFAKARSGYTWLYTEHVLQADEGADFDFLQGSRGHAVPRDNH